MNAVFYGLHILIICTNLRIDFYIIRQNFKMFKILSFFIDLHKKWAYNALTIFNVWEGRK